jgi:Uma2 family endonuclease
MAAPIIKYYSEHDYLDFERNSQERHEFYKGEIFAMSGASYEDNVIEDNLRLIIGTSLKGKSCRSFGSNLRIHIPRNSLYTYPDIMILCGEPKFQDQKFDTVLNPAVLIEILSPSTANYDRGAKFDLYREIDSLKEYILIDSTNYHCVHYNRNADNTWTLWETKNVNEDLLINAVNLKISLSEVYAGITLA